MKKIFSMFIAAAALVLTTSPAFAVTSSVYDALPSVSPSTNYPSLGYQATQTKEFGDYIHLGGTDRVLKNITVSMSDWALFSDYSADPRYMGNSSTWTHPITIKVYSNHLDAQGVPDTLLATKTADINIPWRPVADPTCTTPTAWRATNGQCYNGFAFNANFDLSDLNVTLPNDLIVSVKYNTQTYGDSPLGVNGPYNSLNVSVPDNQLVAVGTDDSANKVFWNTITAGWYADGGAAGVGVLREDSNWTPNGTVALKIEAGPVLVAPPTNKDQCKKDGWKIFNNPSFKNQGDCVSFVEKNKKEDSDEKEEKNREKENKNKESEHDDKKDN
ncbi:MAG: hypothetical protein WC851_00490 [Candidatus Shapirobacteria bacterium]|jgi:hypothetical protein